MVRARSYEPRICAAAADPESRREEFCERAAFSAVEGAQGVSEALHFMLKALLKIVKNGGIGEGA
jgi:hypothetical protein